MTRPTTRILALLELLQSRRQLTAGELAERLDVDQRTVRRYVAQLMELGVPIGTQRGRDGGYALKPGHKLPPMMFTADEALALAMGLRAARELGLNDILPAISSTQAKLERVMPAPLQQRISDVDHMVALDLRQVKQQASSPELLALSAAARAQQRVRLDYLDQQQRASTREVDVYGLAFRGGAWYAVGYCHLRRDVRSFRLDRVQAVEALPASFGKPADFDVLDYLQRAIATLPRQFAVQAVLHTDMATARKALYAEFGTLTPCEHGVMLDAQADNLDTMARDFAQLPFGFRIIEPVALRHAIANHARALLALADTPRRATAKRPQQ